MADRLDMLHFHEEALVPTPIGGGAPSVGSGPPDDLNDETPALCSEPTLGSNPTMSNVHTALYSLFYIFCRLSGGTPLSLPRPPYDRFPYGLTSSADVYARGLRRMPAPPPLTSEFVGKASYAPTYFLDLMDDDVESDGSSIDDVVPSHHPSREWAMADAPGQPPVVAKSLQSHTPLDPRAKTLTLSREHSEELQQQWLHQPLAAPACSAHHTTPYAHEPVSGARGRTRRV